MGFLDNVYKEIIDKKEDIVVKEYGYEANYVLLEDLRW